MPRKYSASEIQLCHPPVGLRSPLLTKCALGSLSRQGTGTEMEKWWVKCAPSLVSESSPVWSFALFGRFRIWHSHRETSLWEPVLECSVHVFLCVDGQKILMNCRGCFCSSKWGLKFCMSAKPEGHAALPRTPHSWNCKVEEHTGDTKKYLLPGNHYDTMDISSSSSGSII